MNTKIDYNNIQNVEKKLLFQRWSELNADEGEIFAWTFNTAYSPEANTFSSVENAKEHELLNKELFNRLADSNSSTSYIIGTEQDYKNAVKNWERDRAKMEAKSYADHVVKIVDLKQQQIKALEALKNVCRTFDGKVINKRFNEAVKAATGFYCYFKETCMSLDKYSYSGPSKENHVYLYYRWYRKKENFWQWTTGDRMEAEKAVSIIEIKLNDLREDIERLNGTKKEYAKYVAKVRKVEKLIEELCCEDIDLRMFAMNHDLKQYPLVTSIWKCS